MFQFTFARAQQDASAFPEASPDRSSHAALHLYERTSRHGWVGRAWAALTGCSRGLLDLQAIEAAVPISHRHAVGIQSVPIQQIQGSEGRCTDFDAAFHPLQAHTQQRWVGLATAWQQGVPLPPVELIRVGEVYFVRDGHHRISVARALGQWEIEAVVTVWQSAIPLPWERPGGTRTLPRRLASGSGQRLQHVARWLRHVGQPTSSA
jgi:hypothetical protein